MRLRFLRRIISIGDNLWRLFHLLLVNKQFSRCLINVLNSRDLQEICKSNQSDSNYQYKILPYKFSFRAISLFDYNKILKEEMADQIYDPIARYICIKVPIESLQKENIPIKKVLNDEFFQPSQGFQWITIKVSRGFTIPLLLLIKAHMRMNISGHFTIYLKEENEENKKLSI